MQFVLSLLLRLVLLAAGLVFAVALVVAIGGLLALWGVRAAWAKLTGRAVSPFVVRVDPLTGFGRVYRRGQGAAASAQRDQTPRREIGDVTDVQAKEPRA